MRAERLLETARKALSNADDAALGEYREYMSHNELGLALDALVDVAARQRAPLPAWQAMADAATEMALDADDAFHGASVRTITAHLGRAAEWFELQRMLNRWDPIGIYDAATNFPEDEYDCMYEPLMTRLRAGSTVEEIAGYLKSELADHFGIDPQPSRPDAFAARLVAWFASRHESA